MPGPYVYPTVDDLEGTAKVWSHSCTTLVQKYATIGKASTWKEGVKIKGNSTTIKKGTAIATFVNGKYPNKKSGNHAAFYISQDANGIKVMDQWGGPSKPKVRSQTLLFKGKNEDGTYKDPSNNGDAFSVIL